MASGSKRSPAVTFMPPMASPSPRNKIRTSIMSVENQTNRSVFTPVLTPGGPDRSMMVLLSPSRTITESLTSLASSTGQQLEQIWDELGYSPEDRADQLSKMILKFREICEQKIAEEEGVATVTRQTIAEAKQEIKVTAAALKAEFNPLDETTPQTLLDELDTLEASLEGLRDAASTAKKDLTECLQYLEEAHQALGLEMDPSYRDTESDLTVSRRDTFHMKKAEMKEELSTRMAAVIQLVRDCQQLMEDLRMEPENGSELERRIAGSIVRSKDGSFIMASKFRSDTCVGMTSLAVEELTVHLAKLHKEKLRRKEKLSIMGIEISSLWEKLHVPEEDQRAFTKSIQGLSLETIEKGENELKRLHALKAQMLGELIAEAREAIEVLWEQTNETPTNRQSFKAFYVRDQSLFDDELLEMHEDYIKTLRDRLEQMKPILRLIERRELILHERIEYDELQKNPERLKTRGAALTRQLMAEEKMAKRIKRELPKLSDILTEKLLEWKRDHGEDFQYKGQVYFDIMERQEAEWNNYKTEEAQRKLKKKQELQTDRYIRPLADNSRHNRPKSQEGSEPARNLGHKQLSTRF